jgi:transposase-like protein
MLAAMKEKKTTYTPAPSVPEDLRLRYQIVLEVMSGALTVSEAARRLGMSRNRFQTLMHRGLEGMLERLAPGAPGRPPKPEREAQLEAELEKVRRENSRLQQRVEMTERLMGLAGEVLRGTPGGAKREPRPKSTKKTEAESDDEQSEKQRVLMRALSIKQAGGRGSWVARIVGVGASTLRRWRRAIPMPGRRVDRVPPLAVVQAVEQRVRELHGLIGADALRHAIPGVSRRQAARIKTATLTAMERERLASCTRIDVTMPGVMRGFDAMEVKSTESRRQWMLVAADACVPFRTSAPVVERYDSAAVAAALKSDFEAHGAPLVVRFDRASAHRTPEVRAVLDAYGVLALHGPPRYPRFYGQLERQNRDHRAWLERAPRTDLEGLAAQRDDMLVALNARWPLRKLAWQTPDERWRARPPMRHNRDELREEVRRRTEQLVETSRERMLSRDVAERLAIEVALSKRGLLRCSEGARC